MAEIRASVKGFPLIFNLWRIVTPHFKVGNRHNVRQKVSYLVNLLDYAVAKTDNEDKDSGQRSFECREQLSKNDSTLNCEEKTNKQNDDDIKLKRQENKTLMNRRANASNQPTVVSFVTDALVL